MPTNEPLISELVDVGFEVSSELLQNHFPIKLLPNDPPAIVAKLVDSIRIGAHPQNRVSQAAGVLRRDDDTDFIFTNEPRGFAILADGSENGTAGGHVIQELAREDHVGDGLALCDDQRVSGRELGGQRITRLQR